MPNNNPQGHNQHDTPDKKKPGSSSAQHDQHKPRDTQPEQQDDKKRPPGADTAKPNQR